jgi:hypothetical protein
MDLDKLISAAGRPLFIVACDARCSRASSGSQRQRLHDHA